MKTRRIAGAVVASALCLPAAVSAESPTARQALQCGTISTSNGGQARFINTYRTTCRTATRVAKKARGRKYTALGFMCKPKKTSGISGLSYLCKNSGATGSLGFIYRAP